MCIRGGTVLYWYSTVHARMPARTVLMASNRGGAGDLGQGGYKTLLKPPKTCIQEHKKKTPDTVLGNKQFNFKFHSILTTLIEYKK